MYAARQQPKARVWTTDIFCLGVHVAVDCWGCVVSVVWLLFNDTIFFTLRISDVFIFVLNNLFIVTIFYRISHSLIEWCRYHLRYSCSSKSKFSFSEQLHCGYIHIYIYILRLTKVVLNFSKLKFKWRRATKYVGSQMRAKPTL